jgi:hypothetical protein
VLASSDRVTLDCSAKMLPKALRFTHIETLPSDVLCRYPRRAAASAS